MRNSNLLRKKIMKIEKKIKNLLVYNDKLICQNCSKKIGNLKSEE